MPNPGSIEQAKELAGEQEGGVEQAEEQAGSSRAGRGMGAGRETCKGPARNKKCIFSWLNCCVVINHSWRE